MMNSVHHRLILEPLNDLFVRIRRRLGGVEGNERLTGATAGLLIALLAVEGITLLFLGRLLSVHVFVGMLLIPPVLLKLGTTGYRFMRYYQRRREYTLKGPPPLIMRFLVGPTLVLSTIGVLGTGVLMIAFGRRGMIVGLHKASFVAWAFAFGIHFLVYVRRLPRLLRPDRRTGGAALRAGAIGVSLVAGIALASVTFPLARPWLHHFRRDHGDDQAAAIHIDAAPVAARTTLKSRPFRLRRTHRSPAYRALGLPPVEPGPVPGYVLIADRNANKLLVVSPRKRIVWQYPRPGDVRWGQSFSDPDDAFFSPDYRRIITNEEFNDQVAEIDLRTHRLVWSYGRAGVAGSAGGELSNPDDAYVWPNRTITVADIKNCRVLRLSPAHRVVAEIGGGSCTHDPPRTLSSPNGATPLHDGGMLVTEIGGWVDRFDRRGRLAFSVRTPTTYPSDAQLLPNGNILVAGFNTPGRVDMITPSGRVVWTYGPSSGPGSLDRPSLAVRWQNGLIAVTDDWHHRIVVIDPRTKQIVWQYGHFGVPSAASGFLSKPDGLDLLPATERRPAAMPSLFVRRVGTLPAATSRLAAAALPDGRILAAGGLVAGTSSSQVLLGSPSRMRAVGRLPAPTHDAALAAAGDTAYLLGGGEAASSDAVVKIDPRTGAAHAAGTLGEPLSDLGATTIGHSVYVVGGYTGARYATGVLRLRPGRLPELIARLPLGLRYAGVAALKGTIYIAGGMTTTGASDAVFAVDPRRRAVRRVATLPSPIAHAPLAALRGNLYLIGGADTTGAPLARILRIDPTAGTVAVAGRLPSALADPAAVGDGRRIVVLGGAAANLSAAVYALVQRRRGREG